MLRNIDYAGLSIGCSIIALVVLLSLALQDWVKKGMGRERLEACHEVGGYYMAAVGTLYAVILGMAVSEASGKYDDARHYIENETNNLLQAYFLVGTFPNHDQARIQNSIGGYVDEVIDQEWGEMQRGGFSKKALMIISRLIGDVVALNPVDERQKTTYGLLINSITDASESRRGRININEYGMQPIEWVTLLIGGAITIVFTFFFNVENPLAHVLMTAMVALILSINLYLVFLLNHPYSGALALPPDQFYVLKNAISITDSLMPNFKR